jgi:hypothetical protein
MDAFDYVETQPTPRRNRGPLIWNILTVLMLVGLICVVTGFIVLFTNPYSVINPFPPPTEIRLLVLPPSTPTAPVLLEPTWTATITIEPTLTSTPRPTNTPLFTSTVTPTSPTVSPTITPGGMSFVVQQGSPQAIANIYDLNAGCDWSGVGGKALDMTGAPLVGIIVQLGGSLEGRAIESQYMLTGTSPQLGQGGFVFKLSDKPVESSKALWIQLLDQQNLPLSDKVYFDTYKDCNKNLILIQFKQVK